jgi:hypothetical protein
VPEVADYPCAAVPRHFIQPYWGFLGKITAASKMKIKPRKTPGKSFAGNPDEHGRNYAIAG